MCHRHQHSTRVHMNNSAGMILLTHVSDYTRSSEHAHMLMPSYM
jgi:hypothetical protein